MLWLLAILTGLLALSQVIVFMNNTMVGAVAWRLWSNRSSDTTRSAGRSMRSPTATTIASSV